MIRNLCASSEMLYVCTKLCENISDGVGGKSGHDFEALIDGRIRGRMVTQNFRHTN